MGSKMEMDALGTGGGAGEDEGGEWGQFVEVMESGEGEESTGMKSARCGESITAVMTLVLEHLW